MHKRSSDIDLLCEAIDEALADGCVHGKFDLTELGEKICVHCGTPAAKVESSVTESFDQYVIRNAVRRERMAKRRAARALARNDTTYHGWTPNE